MTKARGYQQYAANDAGTATPERLVVMAYDGMVRCLKLAEDAMLKKDFERQNHYIQRTQSILGVLSASLNPQYDEALCASLGALYDWFNMRLIEANLNNDAAMVEDVKLRLVDLRESWSQAEQNSRAASAPSAPSLAGEAA